MVKASGGIKLRQKNVTLTIGELNELLSLVTPYLGKDIIVITLQLHPYDAYTCGAKYM